MSDKAPSYEEEQDKLKQEYEGTPDIHIPAPKDPEVNPEVYKDVEPMLFRGFLTLSAVINDVLFVFKSLNHHEFELIRFSGGLDESKVSPEIWNVFLAYGVFAVDGLSVLRNRDEQLPKLVKLFEKLAPTARSRVVRHLSEVNRRASNAVILTEAYAMEVYSRYHWAQIKGLDLTSTAVTGIEGTQQLGMNWAQQVWRALNYFEDRNEQYDRQWENAKFIGSCMAGKGISKIYNQDNDRRQKEKEERLARKDRLLRHILLGESLEDKGQQLAGGVMLAARSVDELAKQVEKDLRGEKDWHDQVVEAHERRIEEGFKLRRQQLEALAKEHEADFSTQYGDKNVVGGTESLQGLSPEEVQFRIERRKQLEAQAVARRLVQPDVSDPKVTEFMRKWGHSDSDTTTSTDQDVSGAVPVVPSTRPRGTPFRRT